jgi:hypothetical protein
LLGFLDEGMQYYNAFAHEEAVERPTDAGMTAGPQLKQPLAKCP